MEKNFSISAQHFAYLPFFVEDSVSTLEGFSNDELSDIKQTILSASDQGELYSTRENLFEKYFKNKEWAWPELSFWVKHAQKTGEYPRSSNYWKYLLKDTPKITLENVFIEMDTSKIRSILTERGFTFECPKRGIQKYLENYLGENATALNALNEAYFDELITQKRKAMTMILFNTIEYRALAQENINWAHKYNFKCKVFPVLDCDKNFFEYSKDYALSDSPPYVPDMLISIKPIIPLFGDKD